MLVVCAPLAFALHLIDPIVRRISGADMHSEDENDISDEVLSALEDHDDADDIDDSQKEMLEAVFELKDTDADEIMTPRTDVQGLLVDATLLEVKKTVLDHGHSRIPVFEESLDNIIGNPLRPRPRALCPGQTTTSTCAKLSVSPSLSPNPNRCGALLAEYQGSAKSTSRSCLMNTAAQRA